MQAALIRDWRALWGEGDFPFYIVQLAAFQATNAEPRENNWAELREAQAWTAKWDGRWQYLVGDGCFHHPDTGDAEPEMILVYSVTPSKVLAFAKGAFSHTSHRF